MNNAPVIVIGGPTASGKTALGVALCRRIGGEVVSADSMQIYRGMDIGTAKPERGEMQGIPHHMIDVAEPWENFSVARWADMASDITEDILARGKTPVIVGGTGLYIDALLRGTDYGAAPGDTGLRERLSAEYDALGGETFRERLREIDPERAEKLPPADKKRLVRAMEVFLLTGETITEHDRRTRERAPRFASRRFARTFNDRAALYARIERRVDSMAAQGLFEEVAALLDAGIPENCTAMQAIGYKEIRAALRGECSREEAIEAVKRESCRYAKRQLTWLRRDKELLWLPCEDYPTAEDAAEQILRTLRQ